VWRLSGDERWLLLLMLLIMVIGQMSLTLQDRMYIWFSYSLAVLNLYIKNKLENTKDINRVSIKV
jgi:hypothetical protein